MAVEKKYLVLFIILFIFKERILSAITGNEMLFHGRRGSGWGRSSRYFTTKTNDVSSNTVGVAGDGSSSSHGDDGSDGDMIETFLKEWNKFYQSYLEQETMKNYNENVKYSLLFFQTIFVALITGIIVIIAAKIGERYVFTHRNRPHPFAGGPHKTLRRSFHLRIRQWKLFLLKKFVSLSKCSKVALVEQHEDNEKIVYAYSIPLEMVQGIKVNWKETGNDPSFMDTKLVVGINTLPVSVFTSYPRIGARLFGEEFTEIDIFGASIPLVEIPMAKSTVDPSDVKTFWERLGDTLAENQDDRLLYIRIPKIGHRVLELSINNGDPAERQY